MCRALGAAGQAGAPAAPATSRIPAETTCLGTARRFPTDCVLSPASHNCHLSLPSHNCQSALFPPPSSHVPSDSLGEMLMSREVISTPLLPLHTHRLHALERSPRPRCGPHTSHFLLNTAARCASPACAGLSVNASREMQPGGSSISHPSPASSEGVGGNRCCRAGNPAP